jgi:hypothetical protein
MTDKPIACTLNAAEQAKRAASSNALVAKEMLAAAATRRGASMTFRPEAERELRELIAAESRCCSFLEFALEPEGDCLRLTVEGPEGALPIIEELFGLEAARKTLG